MTTDSIWIVVTYADFLGAYALSAHVPDTGTSLDIRLVLQRYKTRAINRWYGIDALLALLNLLTRFRYWSIAAGINRVKGVPASLQATSLQVADSRLRSDGRKRGVFAA